MPRRRGRAQAIGNVARRSVSERALERQRARAMRALEPALVAELDAQAMAVHALDAMLHMGMSFAVGEHPGRELKVHQAQLAGGLQRRKRFPEAAPQLVANL